MAETGKRDLVLGVIFIAMWAVMFAWVMYNYKLSQSPSETLHDATNVRLFLIMNAGSILLLALGIQRLANYFRGKKSDKD